VETLHFFFFFFFLIAQYHVALPFPACSPILTLSLISFLLLFDLVTLDLPEKAIPPLLQLLTLTISRYEDRKSRLLVEKVLATLLTKSYEALKVLVYLLEDLATEGTRKGAEG